MRYLSLKPVVGMDAYRAGGALLCKAPPKGAFCIVKPGGGLPAQRELRSRMTARGSRERPHREDSRHMPARTTDFARRVSEIFAGERPDQHIWSELCNLVADALQARCVTLALREESGGQPIFIIEERAHTFEAGSFDTDAILSGILESKRSVHLGSVLGAPLLVDNTAAGAILVEGHERYAVWQATLLDSCALFVAARLHDRKIRRESQRYHELAYTDALTGIANRRRFDEALIDEWKRASRTAQPLTLIMIDVDFFKAFNDTYGHQAGDRCLQSIASALRASVSRPGDLVARYGGEEFVALVPSTPLSGGIVLAEAFREAVALEAIPHAASSLGHVSLSIGVACAVPDSDGDARMLLHAADAALYHAKESGRNRVVGEDYESHAESIGRAAQASKTNLPVHGSALIGRLSERAELRALLDMQRLVSIVGVGGSGKTRLALHVLAEYLDAYEDGVWFVDLSMVTEPSQVAAEIGSALSLPIPADESGIDALVHALRRKSLLLLLDNCEHLVQTTGAICTRVLDDCPDIRVVVTSRSKLGVGGEHVYRLPLLREDDAAELFIERAKSAKPSFSKTAANAAVIAEICSLVEGIALCIELIAARAAVASIEQIAERLRESFWILTSGRRNELPRHQTVRALIGWSYDLLSEPERRLFRRLAVFAGGWTLEQAAGICTGQDLDPFDLFELHGSLADKSIVADDAANAQTRYRLLEPIREYAREQLEASGELALLQHRHAEHFAQCAQDVDSEFYTTPSRAWFSGVQRDLPNFRAALEWTLAGGNDPLLGATIAGALSWYFGYLSPAEGVRWIRAALHALGDEPPPSVEARLQLALTPLYGLPPVEKRAAGERAVLLYRATDDLPRLSHALRMFALTLAWYFPDERAQAQALVDEAGTIARDLGDPISIALVLQAQSQVLDARDLAGRRSCKEQAYELLRRHGNDRQIAVVLIDLSEGAFAEGETKEALRYGREALRLAVQSGSRNTILCAGINLVYYAAAESDWDTARNAAAQALVWAEESHAAEFLTYTLDAVACIAAECGRFETAARLFGFCNARLGTVQAPRHDGMSEDVMYRRAMEHLKSAIPADTLEHALGEGAALCEDDAIAQARQVVTQASASGS